jgi:hypothetical protein
MSAYQEIEIEVEWCPLPIVVGGYYMKAERGSREDGIQMEPDLPAYFEIENVTVKGSSVGLLDAISESTYDEFVRLASEHFTGGV